VGLQPRDVTIAELLKPLGYATGQFGKNHLGDRDEFLPTTHGFDEFFSNLYHLNADVLYTADNGPHMNSWPDGAMTPFRSEKNTNWEGAFRVTAMIRWPGKIQAGAVSNEIFSGLDWLPTALAAAGEPDITAKLLKGHTVGAKTFKVHLDGYNQQPYLLGQQLNSARNKLFYFDDDGNLVGMRYADWKIVFSV
jgi:arylsulfatase